MQVNIAALHGRLSAIEIQILTVAALLPQARLREVWNQNKAAALTHSLYGTLPEEAIEAMQRNMQRFEDALGLGGL